MSGLLASPRLPKERISLTLISGEYPEFARKLNDLGIETVLTEADKRLPKPVAFHPDMQFCRLSKDICFVLKHGPLRDRLLNYGINARETRAEPESEYPKDVLCNAFVIGNSLVANFDAIDSEITAAANDLSFVRIFVRQGYAACSVAVVDEKSVITADKGIAETLEGKGFEVLCVSSGGIELPGYDTGFIGGCCGKISENEMVFTGSIDKHPDGKAVRAFLNSRGVSAIELSKNKLMDIGGIIPLR